MAVQADDGVVVGGVSSFGATIGPSVGNTRPLLLRLDPGGDLDQGFPPLTHLPVGEVTDVAAGPGGILALGYSFNRFSFYADFVLLGRQADGTPDDSFPGPDGSVHTDFNHGRDLGTVLGGPGEGRVVVAGPLTGKLDMRIGVARYRMGGGRRDQDADGIRDKRDRCPTGHAKRRPGCPKLNRSLSAKFGDIADIDVSLSSDTFECADGERILIRRARPGRDPVVDLATVTYDEQVGATSYFEDLSPGRYYALARRHREPVGICPRVRSRTGAVVG